MLRIRNYFIAIAVVFAISSAYALIGVQDAKADAALGDLIKRIEALESSGGGNVTTGARKLKIGFQIRTRFEQQAQFQIGSGNASVTSATTGIRTSTSVPLSIVKGAGSSHRGVRESNEFIVQRVRLTFDFDVNKNVRGFMMIDDNRTFGAEQNTIGYETLGMREGYVDLRNLGDLSPILENITIRAGRWQMFYGDHRLIGHLNWTNTGRAWDGARVKWDNKKGSWIDFFVTKVTTDNTGAAAGDQFTSTGLAVIAPPALGANRDELFWGLYSHFKNPFGVEGIVAEPYLIIRDRSVSDRKDAAAIAGEERYSAGLRLVGKKIPSLPGVDFTFEQTWQFGHTETKTGTVLAGTVTIPSQTIQAFAGAWGVGYTFGSVPWSPRIGYQYAFASGDDNIPAAGTANFSNSSKTFSQLYPTGHARLGYIDFHAWQNIRAHKIMLTLKPTKKLLMKADLWFFEADEEADSWYGVAGPATRAGADRFVHTNGQTGNVDDEYGQEIDITVKYKLFKNFGIVSGYTHYFTGDFMEDTNNGLDRDSDWFYLQTALKF